VFLFAADDVLLMQRHASPRTKRSRQLSVRDNVLFEAGVFMGGLGNERTFLVVPGGITDSVRTPSDLQGLLTTQYRPSSRGVQSAVAQATKLIANCIWELGPVPRTEYDELLALAETMSRKEFRKRKNGKIFVLKDLLKHASQRRRLPWHVEVEPMSVMRPISDKCGKTLCDDVYWWLVVEGVFRFKGIDRFTSGESWHWKESIAFVSLSRRGAALMNLIREGYHDESV
jgi:hypothetical protein